MKRSAIMLGLALGLAATACKKDGGKGGGDGKGGGHGDGKGGGHGDGKGGGHGDGKGSAVAAADAPPAAPAIAFEPVTIDAPEVVVGGRAPVGWTRTDLSATVASWADPKGGMFPSTMTLSAECGGDCGTIAANAKKLADAAIADQVNAGYQATITRQGELPGGGVELEFESTKASYDPMYGYVRFLALDGIPMAAKCMVMGVGKDAKAIADALANACQGLTLTKK